MNQSARLALKFLGVVIKILVILVLFFFDFLITTSSKREQSAHAFEQSHH